MKSIDIPENFSIEGWSSTVNTVFNWVSQQPDLIVLQRFIDSQWQGVTAREFSLEVENVARGLIAQGVQPGDKVALLSATRYEWPLLDYAIWAAGAVTVPIFESSSAEQIRWILEDSNAVSLIIETDDHAKRIVELAGNIYNVKHVYQIEVTEQNPQYAIDELTDRGEGISSEEVHRRIAATSLDDPATLIYTSGTTGKPKGVILTHRNFISEALSIINTSFKELFTTGTSTLFFLPLAHVFARAISIAAYIAGSTVGHFGDTNKIIPQFAIFKPDYIISVPRVFEKVYNGAHANAVHSGKGKIFDIATRVAISYSKAIAQGKVPLNLKIRHRIFDKLVYGKLRAILGGKCTLAISGGAPLGERLGHFFQGISIPIYEGYGLTETTAAITVNTIGYHKIGTVGKPLPGQSVAISDDGEVLLKGSVVFNNYWHNPTATTESLVDGWFRTGDLGNLDEEGYLTITGRKKELIVTAGGKNVSPTQLEDILRANKLISQAMLVGDGKPFIGAFITIDPQAFEQWKKETNKPLNATVADLRDDPDLLSEINNSVSEANKTVSNAECIKKVRVLAQDFSVETGELTQTLKIKRTVVIEKYKDDYHWIYNL